MRYAVPYVVSQSCTLYAVYVTAQLREMGMPPVCTSGIAVHIGALKQRGESCTMRERLFGNTYLTKVRFVLEAKLKPTAT